MKMSGAQMVCEAIIAEGVKTVFGYPGGAIMNVYDEIYKQNAFKHILTRHEQAAVHAADGYARATGEVGVAMVTSGPGFTNAVTGLATAYMDSVPLVVISGQVPLSLIGTDGFQEVDAVGISRPCTKHNYLVRSIEDLPRILKEAFYIARSGRPGPVLVDIPKDITGEMGEFIYPDHVNLPTYKPRYKGNDRQIKKAVEAIVKAKKPLLYIGGGTVLSNAYQEVREFAELTQIPTVETLMARGVMGAKNPLLVGMLGMHGSYAANMAMSETDLIISLGARFDDRVTGKLSEFARYADIIHVDIDPANIGKLVDVDYPIVGDVKTVVNKMLEMIREKVDPDRYQVWRDILARYDELHPLSYTDSDEVIKPQWVVERVGELVGSDAIITSDVGQHQMWTAQFYPFDRPRQWINSGGLGTMGYGFPAAIGAKVGVPEKTVINFTGDGSILMNVQELVTAAEYGVPVINIILNNHFLGMVRQWQTFFYDKRYSETDLSYQPDWKKLAEACGGAGYDVTTKAEFDEALRSAMEGGKVTFINVAVDRFENVLPMVPAGGALYNMLLEHKDQ
ncbi:acetolactate synthase large subunit [Nitratifractor salsuginis]|uniref:Acetolactate synthase n=1 Tax=Nitratifractor salsuginis (strain DSM 16511 / JCM 12458 / E9I37-1) TaxID=749222 RepID=E6X0M7_NITSE|nr:acetolactate synthase large subunit [Nitratifractor salsuginis]ADV45747.1 acetolactate synthase, large subunit [Nitratifractor salsuginis DSM 16511]